MKPFISKSGDAQANGRVLFYKEECSPTSENPEINSLVEKPCSQREVQLIHSKLAYPSNSFNNSAVRQGSNSYSKFSELQRSASNLEYNDKTSSFQKVVKGNATALKQKR